MQVFLGLGSNIGCREEMLRIATDLINKRIGKVISLSAFYDTEPSGFDSKNHFLNAACCISTLLTPFEILEHTEAIEKELGRTSKSSHGIYCDRMIDIDILLAEELILKSERLTIPHPLMHERDFVLRCLVEIAPSVIHPMLGKSIQEIFNRRM